MQGERAEKEACLHESLAVAPSFTKQQFVLDPQKA